MILTLTPNPSLDLAYELDTLSKGEVQRTRSFSVEAGGKGINVSRNLVANGLASRAIAPVGGLGGEQFLSLLEESGIELIRVPISGAIRTNVGIVEKGGAETKINAPGPRLSEKELERILEEVESAARGAEWLVVCGSLPPETPVDLYARIVALGHEAGCCIAVDSSGPPLEAALQANPDLIKPNLEELSELAGMQLVTIADILTAIEEVRSLGARTILVSLGADGAILSDDEGTLHAETPPFTPRSTVGAGDALLSGFLSAARDREAGLTEAVAWGAAATRLPGSRGPKPGDLDRVAVHLHKRFDKERQLRGEVST